MTTIQQIEDFSRFAKQLVEEGNELPLDAIFDRWHEEAFREEDLVRVQESVNDFKNGERGRPIEQFLAEFDSRQRADKS